MEIAVVTGASSGIGQSAAVHLARRGAGVIVTYHGNEQGGRDTVATIERAGGRAVALPLDVSRSETFADFKDTVARVIAATWNAGTVTYLVNNAGFGGMASAFEDTTEELFDSFMRVHLKGPYFLTQALLPLLADGGAIVNTSSNAGLSSGLEPGYSAYATMKGGLTTLTRYMAKEFSPRGIRVNSVAPGSTRTRIADDAFAKYPEIIPAIAARTALGRLGEPDDIGPVIAALLSDECRWITAQNIEVSGGYNL